MKRGPDLDIEALFTDLENDPLAVVTDRPDSSSDIEDDTDPDDHYIDEYDDGDDEYSRDDEYSDR